MPLTTAQLKALHEKAVSEMTGDIIFDGIVTVQAQPALILVLRFNAFTGQLEDGYLANRQTMLLIGKPMKPAEALAYLIANPETRCDPIKV